MGHIRYIVAYTLILTGDILTAGRDRFLSVFGGKTYDRT